LESHLADGFGLARRPSLSTVPAGTEFEGWAASLRAEYAVFLRHAAKRDRVAVQERAFNLRRVQQTRKLAEVGR